MKSARRLTESSIRRSGFSLLELIVVLVILGLLASLVGLRVSRAGDKARWEAARTQLAQLRQALTAVRLECGRYPTTDEGLRALVENPGIAGWDGPYLEENFVPSDPWNHDYHYVSPGQHGEYDLWTYGADGAPGGDGVRSDITSWARAGESAGL